MAPALLTDGRVREPRHHVEQARGDERSNRARYALHTILLIICCAVFYYRLGEFEYGSGGLLALASVAVWVIGTLAFRFGWLGNLLVQVGLFFALTVWHIMRRERE